MASTSPSAAAADPLATLAGLYTSSFLIRLTALPRASGWRLELSEDDGGTWTSLEAGQAGHATPALAIDAGAASISAWKESRIDAGHAEISIFFSQGKLERRKILTLDENNIPIEVDGYAAKSEDGEWIEDLGALEAIKKAKSRTGQRLKAIKPLIMGDGSL
jgi:hypothetical protein